MPPRPSARPTSGCAVNHGERNGTGEPRKKGTQYQTAPGAAFQNHAMRKIPNSVWGHSLRAAPSNVTPSASRCCEVQPTRRPNGNPSTKSVTATAEIGAISTEKTNSRNAPVTIRAAPP